MIRRSALAGTVTAVAALAAAPAAFGQSPVVQAVDGTDANHYVNSWTPRTVTIKAGGTVTWSFSGSQVFHNVASGSANWDFRNGNPAVAPPPASFTFDKPGTYRFLCQLHTDTMWGDVVVTDATGKPPPPPPPPPLSEQPFPNDAGAPGSFEVADALGPRVSRVRVRGRRHGARVRFRVDEPAVVAVRVKQARLTIKRRRALVLAGRRSMRFRGLERGTYRIEIVARDLAGNRSRTYRRRVAVR